MSFLSKEQVELFAKLALHILFPGRERHCKARGKIEKYRKELIMCQFVLRLVDKQNSTDLGKCFVPIPRFQ
ncbi:hypothetical protein D3C73_849150 [compost metagenome]